MAGCVALVVAAGRGARFGGDVPKQYKPLGGEALLRRSVLPLVNHPQVHAVRTIIHPEDRELYDIAVHGLSLMDPVPGGDSRQESVRRGLESLADDAPETVLIHDAARPFVTRELVSRILSALQSTPGAIPAMPVRDTLKKATAENGGLIAATVDRSALWRAQTPQGFRYLEILAAHRRLTGATLTDDAAVAEQDGLSVTLVPGDEDNFKVTTQDDFDRAERLLTVDHEVRTGIGFDVHRFGAGDHVILCGVSIPHEAGLEGHSDADVGLHALTDALLGAIGAGDIGSHFPPGDPQWRGAPSEVFLRRAGELVAKAGGRISNVDVTVICERPRIGSHRQVMRERIASILDLPPDRVSVKGTTTERLGFTGRGEGIAAQAIATVRIASAR
jgi:2-C-methyl-D-erythritol 4-phosphate cytidylyltransferase/2-C-methyl-D-erythritol 2,4-cyclodiphosphate synthase